MSRDLHTVASLIQQLKSYDEAQTLESLLEKEEFTRLLHGIYTSLSTKSKGRVQGLFRNAHDTRRKKSKSPALATILGIRDIALPPGIQNQYQIWKEDPRQFWWSLEGEHIKVSFEVAAIEAYRVIRNLRSQQADDVILRRFYVTFFYRLALFCGHGQKFITNNLHNILYELLGKALTGSKKITDDTSVIKANLQNWVAAGSRYNKICMALDEGALFLIPQIPDDMWENPNSLKGVEFDEAMSHLQREGITKLSNHLGADGVAKQILSHALDPFRWQVTLSAPTANLPIAPRTSTASTSIKQMAPNVKTNSISSLLNPPEAAQVQLELRNPRGKRKRVDSVSIHDVKLRSRISWKMEGCPMNKDAMVKVLGKCLFDGIMRSRKRLREGDDKFTNAICAVAPYSNLTQDFVYRIWVDSTLGKEMLRSTLGGDGLKELLDDILLEGMEKSICRQEELKQKKPGGTSTFKISLNNDYDYVVEMKMSFHIGKSIMFTLYSHI